MDDENKKVGASGHGNPQRAAGPEAAGRGASSGGEEQATMVYSPTTALKEEAAPVQPTLEVVSGSANKSLLTLGEEKVTLGRVGFNDLILNDKKVSRSHAAIYFEKGHYVVEDLNSTNGVTVDGNPVKKIVLKSGNRIGLGDCVLLFKQDVPEISHENQIDFINGSDLFNWLDEETRGLLAKNLALRFFPKNTTVLRQNTSIESMYFLYSGSARVVEFNEEGGERVIDQLNPGDAFGESALLAGESGKYSVVSSTDLQVLELKREQLNQLLQTKPELFKAFYRMVLKKFSAAQAKPEAVDARMESLRHLIVSTDVGIVGEDKKIKDAVKKIETFAKENKTVLITGLSGTGKKNLARYFHKVSAHPEYPYIEISVAELEEGKAGPTIFGVEADPEATHMKGQIGYLEMIGTGTLAIGHVEALDAHQQSKLATYIKYGWFHRVYGRESVKAKTTVVLIATGTEAEVMEKLIPELRELLKGQSVYLPPLVQRLKDIPVLAEHYLQVFARKNGKRVSGLSREATERLVSYTWPGNVKELENVIQRAAIVSSEDVIIPGDLIFVIPSEKEIHKLNLLRTDKIRDFFRHPLFPKFLTWFNIAVVAIMAGFTLYGGSRPADHPLQDFGNNPGMLITWLIWFPILPISAFLIGRIWCGMCPIAGIGALAAKIKSFNLPVPKLLKRMDFWMVVVAFLFLDYVEELAKVADKPYATGLLLVIIIGCSALFCVLFERKTFCRYVCPLAGMLGAYSTMSVMEVRGNKKVCQTQCGQHACYKGSDNAEGCPMFSYPASLATNCECMMCFNCLKSCDNRGVQLNLRPPLQELWRQAQPALSISLFCVMMVGLMGRHQFPKLTAWKVFEQSLGWSDAMTHTVVYSSFVLLAVIPFFLSALLSAAASQEKVSENMAHYGLAFIPLALAGHLSHVFHEFLNNGVYDLLGYFVKVYRSLVGGIPIGSEEVTLTHFINPAVVEFIKFLFVTGGLTGSIIALVMIARRASTRNVLGRIMPHVLLLLFFWACYLFIFLSPTGDPPGTAEAATTATAETTAAASQSATTTSAGSAAAKTAAQAATTSAPAATQPKAPAAGSISVALTNPAIKNAPSAALNSAGVAKWIQSAKQMPATKQYRLTVQGQVTGASAGVQVRASLDSGTLKHQFMANPDASGNFSGDVFLDSVTQKIPLVFQVVDPKTNSVLFVHKVNLN